MTTVDDYTSRGALRRWMLIDGYPRCPYDAIEPYRLSPAEAAAILAANEAVRTAVAAVEALEAARRVRAGETPAQTIPGADENGDPAMVPNPAWQDWQAAGATIAGADEDTLALEAIRNGSDVEREPDVIGPDPFEDRLAVAEGVAAYQEAVAAHLDATARSRQYDNALSLATYVGSSIEAWAAEAAVFVAWRDAVWAYALSELAKVQNAQRSAPPVSEFIAELPAIEWP